MKINKNIDLLKAYNPDVSFFNTGAITKIANQATSALTGGFGGTASATQSLLLSQQQELQLQMMLTSMKSNILRTEHETKMAAVRNMRVA